MSGFSFDSNIIIDAFAGFEPARAEIRRAAENGSGTDHGAAGIGFLIGTRAAGRMVGEFPGVDRLDADGNLRATSDFRGVYGALCGDWFGVDPAAILPDARGIGKPVVLK